MVKIKHAAHALEDADAALTSAALPYRHAPPVELLAWASEIGDQPQMRAVCGAVFGLGLIARDRRLTMAGARMLAAHTLATLAKDAVKKRVDRTRPRSRNGRKAHRMKVGRNTDKEETSFPSGHTAGAIAAARAFAREYPDAAVPAYAAAGLIALAQIPRCAHYPTDVGAGLMVGLAAEVVVDRLWNAAEQLAAQA